MVLLEQTIALRGQEYFGTSFTFGGKTKEYTKSQTEPIALAKRKINLFYDRGFCFRVRWTCLVSASNNLFPTQEVYGDLILKARLHPFENSENRWEIFEAEFNAKPLPKKKLQETQSAFQRTDFDSLPSKLYSIPFEKRIGQQ
eukprot:TRINITY_DN56775_c0_g1_i1.p1 TRINITY_DN56775_c0_g1~~TRINITY_DN56775_c0_g1_i1.p1  ORF type:complete len:143 (+),score=22.02 TRINITY_DN56775_c0_g1_i1:311-739(+)